ncbi:DUF6113 family protein [Streptomyces sp. NPDC056361]|uniref:DUF6113 family protein n=1 Tax=Streptomyces sp. NPDC056361 TaxID=3345795 RepID=UPI0035D7B74E
MSTPSSDPKRPKPGSESNAKAHPKAHSKARSNAAPATAGRATAEGSAKAAAKASAKKAAKPSRTPDPMPSQTARYVWYGVLVVLGALVGTAGALVQAAWLPLGLVLALLATAALFYGGLRATGTQVAVAAAGGGWLVAIVLLSLGRPEGDGAFGGGVGELLFLFGGMAAAVMCTTLSRLPRPTP